MEADDGRPMTDDRRRTTDDSLSTVRALIQAVRRQITQAQIGPGECTAARAFAMTGWCRTTLYIFFGRPAG
jgi:hypothetical protein